MACGFPAVHSCIHRIRFYERRLDFVGSSPITSGTDLLTLPRLESEGRVPKSSILSKFHSVRDFLSDLPISFLERSLF